MGRVTQQKRSNAGVVFMATLVVWLVSIVFEIAFSKRNELLPVLVGCLFFQSANWVFRFWVSRDPLFVNTCVSLLHSLITSASVVFILLNQLRAKSLTCMFDHEQLVSDTWTWAYPALSLFCGYFAYDQLDMLQHRLYSGWIPSILMHHLILLVCFTLALYRKVTINYLIITLICEVEWVLNCSTFLFARSIPHALIMARLIRDALKFGKGIELPLALFGMVGMNSLNIGLGIDLLGTYKRERNAPEKRHDD